MKAQWKYNAKKAKAEKTAKYTKVIKREIEPMLKKKIVAGKFKKSSAAVKLLNNEFIFKVCIDNKGMAIGEGESTSEIGSNVTGTFYKNVPHGQIVCSNPKMEHI